MADSVSVVHTKTPVVVIHNPSDRVVVVKVGTVISGGSVGSDGGSDIVLWTDIQGKPTTFPPSIHNHDDRYFTEAEVTAFLAGKAASVHTHTIANVTGLQSALDGKADDSEITTLTNAVNSKADSSTVSALTTTVAGKETPAGAQAKADAALASAEAYTDNAVDALVLPIVLGPTDPVPAGTPAGTIIVRTT